jgi:hypothetical protein
MRASFQQCGMHASYTSCSSGDQKLLNGMSIFVQHRRVLGLFRTQGKGQCQWQGSNVEEVKLVWLFGCLF